MSETSVKTEKLTHEFCKGRTLIFSPKTTEEARDIQLALFDMGFYWGNDARGIQYLQACVDKKMVLTPEGKLFTNPDPESFLAAVYCTVGQLEMREEKILTAFNEISARIGALEEKMDKILEALQPQGRLDKPSPKNSF